MSNYIIRVWTLGMNNGKHKGVPFLFNDLNKANSFYEHIQSNQHLPATSRKSKIDEVASIQLESTTGQVLRNNVSIH